jgi:hypothetical protein
MAFRVSNVLLQQSILTSYQNTQNQISNLSYTPVWIYDGVIPVGTLNSKAGYFNIYDSTGYKVINLIDANGINIKNWINTLATIRTNSSSFSIDTYDSKEMKQVTLPFKIYMVTVDNESGNSNSISELNIIVDNQNNTYTLAGGDILTGAAFVKGKKYYMSYFCKNQQ